MNRCRYLVLLSAGLVAGCSQPDAGSDGSADTQTQAENTPPTPTPTPTPTATESETETRTTSSDVDEHLNGAEDSILEAVRLVEEQAANVEFVQGETSVSTAAIDAALSNARDDLDAAESGATSEQAARINLYRDLVEYLDLFASALSTVDEAANSFSTAGSYENTGRYEDAAGSLQEAAASFNEASSTLQEAGEILSGVDAQISGTSDIDLAQMQPAQEELRAVVDAYHRYSEASAVYDQGLADFYRAGESYDNEDYVAAEADYSNALDHFTTAEERYSAGESEVAQEFVSLFISQTCRARAYEESADLMLSASREAQQRNFSEARDLATEADEALNRDCRTG